MKVYYLSAIVVTWAIFGIMGWWNTFKTIKYYTKVRFIDYFMIMPAIILGPIAYFSKN
jgi:hypothetical protein